MPDWIPLDSKQHKDYRVTPTRNFIFTENDNLCSLVIAELRNLLDQIPIMFAKNEQSVYELCALQGLEENKNYLVTDDGVWKGSYIPAQYRAYPFIMANEKNSEKKILCFDKDSGLVNDHQKPTDLKLFDEKGKPSEQTLKLLEFFRSIDESRKITAKALEMMRDLDLFEDWNIKIKNGSDEKVIKGIKKINFTKFHTLDSKVLLSLRDTGAFEIIFGHYFSMKNVEKLIKLSTKKLDEDYESHKDRALARQTTAEKKEVDNLVQNLLLDD